MNEESIFTAALEKKTPQEREVFLEGVCAANPELRAKVESLLRAHDDAGLRLVRTSCSSRSAKAGLALSTWPTRRSRSRGGWH